MSYCCHRLAASPSRSPVCEGGRDGERLLGMLDQHNPSMVKTEGRGSSKTPGGTSDPN